MRLRMIAFCCGVVLLVFVPRLILTPIVLNIAVAALLAVWEIWAKRSFFIPSVLLGFLWSFTCAQIQSQQILPHYLEGQDLWLRGYVDSIPEQDERSQQFEFQVLASCVSLLPQDCDWSQKVFKPRRILLSSYGSVRIKTGETWLWRVRLNRPHGLANPGAFDYEAWMFQKGLSAKGYIRQTSFNARLPTEHRGLNTWRFKVYEFLQLQLQGLDNRALILALVLGVRHDIESKVWTLLTSTGTNHLMVISGLHIGLCALFAYWLASFLARLFPSVLLHIPAQKIGLVFGLGSAVAYAALAGFTLPSQRALIMLIVFSAARLSNRKIPISTAYLLALFLVLLVQPLSILSTGFWLSFVAVGSLIFALSGYRMLGVVAERSSVMNMMERAYRRWLRPQWVVSIGLCAPLMVLLQQVSLVAPLVNTLAIPVVSLFIVPVCLLATALSVFLPAASRFLFSWANECLGYLLWLMSALSDWLGQFSTLAIASPGPFALLCLCVGVALLLLPRGLGLSLVGMVLLLPALLPSFPGVAQGQARVTILDVGQGLAVVVQTQRHALLYDTGPQMGNAYDTGRAIVFPYLLGQGIRRIDRLLVSHGDNDHAGGLGSLLKLMRVNQVQSSHLGVLERASKVTNAKACRVGEQWSWDGVSFRVLYPPPDVPYRGNNSSCVLLVEAGSQRLLLPGDIEGAAERAIIENYGAQLAANVLVAPHHGSNTSSSEPFIRQVSPSIVLYSAGYRSQFSHPSAKVVQRYDELGARAFNTAVNGALVFNLGGNIEAMQPVGYRQDQPRFWQAEFSEQTMRLHGLEAAQ
ncbi:MAG: DNA internalization-related competence protein ComEC/Rec2 [Pseudohongiellaceae bacterium]|nr:DNA internalization-related competence protein ComEC/Rec2 [Pseudohongiellaceae bacterium]